MYLRRFFRINFVPWCKNIPWDITRNVFFNNSFADRFLTLISAYTVFKSEKMAGKDEFSAHTLAEQWLFDYYVEKCVSKSSESGEMDDSSKRILEGAILSHVILKL